MTIIGLKSSNPVCPSIESGFNWSCGSQHSPALIAHASLTAPKVPAAEKDISVDTAGSLGLLEALSQQNN